jgi:multidrug transporter EmrE-like cation transporter
MIARVLVSVGVVAASVGFTFLGIATSTYETHDDALNVAYALMAGGGIASVVGILWYRSHEGRHG